MKFKIVEDGARADTSLRKCLEILANELGYNLDGVWCLHHYNGNHNDNRLENLILMKLGRHSSFHKRIKNRGLLETDKEAIDMLNNEYGDSIIYIGKILYEKLSLAKQESEEDDKKVL